LPFLDKEKLISHFMGHGKRFVERLVLFAVDFAFALFCGCAFILLQYYTNDGTPRAFSFFGVVIGFCLYYFSIGKLTGGILWRVDLIIRIILAYFFLPFERMLNRLNAWSAKRRDKRKEQKKKAHICSGCEAQPISQRLLAAPSKQKRT
jgi:hypothetical protein